MSESNGVIKLGRKGKRKLQYDDGSPVVEVDVVACANQWALIDDGFRQEGEVPRERREEFYTAAWQFARGHLQVEDISLADALHFLKVVTEEAEALQGFFAVKRPAAPSSGPPSAAPVTRFET